MPDDRRWLKHRINGVVHQYTDILAGHEEMIECDRKGRVLDMSPRVVSKPTGLTPFTKKSDAKTIVPGADLSGKSLRDLIDLATTDQQVKDLAARFDIGFADGMSIEDMKAGLIEELTKRGKFDPVPPAPVKSAKAKARELAKALAKAKAKAKALAKASADASPAPGV